MSCCFPSTTRQGHRQGCGLSEGKIKLSSTSPLAVPSCIKNARDGKRGLGWSLMRSRDWKKDQAPSLFLSSSESGGNYCFRFSL